MNLERKTGAEVETPEMEKTTAAEKPPEVSKERTFELVGLKEAWEKGYPWAKEAEAARKFLKRGITSAEREIEVIKGGVKENTPLYRAVSKRAESIFKERQLKNEAGTSDSDFFTAIEEIKKDNEFRLGLFNDRWQRLEVLSSASKGAEDPELNEKAYYKAEELRKKDEQVDNLKCNDESRKELLLELRSKITEKEVESQRKEQEKTAILREEMVESFDATLSQLKDNPGTGRLEIIDREQLNISYKRTQGFFKELTGEDLNNRAKAEAKIEAEKEGKKIMKKEEFFGEANRAKAEKQEQLRRWGEGIRMSWEGLSDEERQKIGNIKQYAKELEAQRRLLAEKKGIDIPQDVYYDLLKQGLKPQELKLKGWFKKKIHIPVVEGMLSEAQFGKKPLVIKALEGFRQENSARQESIKQEIKEIAQAKLEQKYLEGRDSLLRRRIRKAEELVCTVVELRGYKRALKKREEEYGGHEKKISEQREIDALEKVDWAGEEKKIKDRFDKRRQEVEQVLKEALSLLGLGPKEELPAEIKEAVLAKQEQIKAEYDSAMGLLEKRKKLFETQKKAKITKEIKEKLANI